MTDAPFVTVAGPPAADQEHLMTPVLGAGVTIAVHID